ncbi:insecticidal toxin complex protein TccC [Pseudomonas sp. NFACC02]|uniref:RHS repeat-associated core domain-containing protein n=1 Tax=Pseudomonas sp. NFACC02 TaxID=1566250 RepID=UPI0008B43880|nr:RHS repeat-associated core domain-containing protein [Pseudomonas sp. NFACC02]SER47221.1 insecticidal toxin complex protein TccC [Pseudomonas sp. NFACC02]
MSLHTHTPQLLVIDPRAFLIREVAYCRSDAGTPAEERVARRIWDVAGRHVADWDPRLWAEASRANTSVIRSLSGRTLLEDSVDAGWRLNLSGANEQTQKGWDGRGRYSLTECDELLRPVSITQQTPDADATVVERLTYGDASAPSNQRGRLIRHDDPAGTWRASAFSLTGGVLMDNRRYLLDPQMPDWPAEPSARDALLEPGEGHTTTYCFNATATLIGQIDALGNQQTHQLTVDGLLWETSIQLAGSATPQTLIDDIRYNPFGQVISECLGNGVRTENIYEPETGRLIGIKAQTSNGTVLQNLTYEYDPVGNIVRVEDLATSSTARNINADPASLYRYDSLYQLVEATGREVKTGFSHGPALPDQQPLLPDPNQLTNYTQTYTYDAGANLLQMRHVGDHSFTRTMQVASDSNRSLPEGELETDLENGFDANGNLQELVRGQPLLWDARNQLRQVTNVQREDGSHDDELYVYDGYGQRCRKIRRTQTNARTLNAEVRYLPGLEIRSEPDGELLHVVSVQAGHSSVRILHWHAEKPEGIDNDQVRYTLQDHLGSSALELDHQSALISQEGYYPFGGTAWWAARSAVEAKYKTVRYSGKERDVSGLYYYGFRYYAPWLMRWINPDPSGNIDGLNIYRFVSNSPINKLDPDGTTQKDAAAVTKVQSYVRRFLNPVRVKTLRQGVISVTLKGDNSVFSRAGMMFDRSPKAARELTYVALDNRFKGKVSGGDISIKLGTAEGPEISAASHVRPSAYINGSYFNMGRNAPNQSSPDFASVGENLIDGQAKPSIPLPERYAANYSRLTLHDGSFIHVAPRLTIQGLPQFSRRDSLKAHNIYGEETSHVGALGHASDPNARSGISLAEDDPAAKTRLAIGLNPGRGTFANNRTDEPGFTMFEWTTVMSRLDHLNTANEEKFHPASSWNLDGGDSSTLGVLDESGNHLLRVNTLRVGSRGMKPARPIGNFLTFF